MNSRRLLLPALVLLLLGGCSHGGPILPLALAVQPIVWGVKHISDNELAGMSNTDISISGRLIDQDGNLLENVAATITTWSVIHRNNGAPDKWQQQTESRKLGGDFKLTFRNSQFTDVRLSHPGHFNERIAFLYGGPQMVKTVEPDSRCDAPSGPVRMEQIDGGGALYFVNRRQHVKDLHVVLSRHGSLKPVIRIDATLVYQPDAQSAAIDVARAAEDAVIVTGPSDVLPLSTLRLMADLADGGKLAVGGSYADLHNNTTQAQGLRLSTPDPDGGFVPIALGGPGENRLPFLRTAPATGYQKDLPMVEYVREHAPHGRLYRATSGEIWFYFKINGRYGVGTVTPRPPPNEHVVKAPVVLYVQPDGTRDLGAADPDNPPAAPPPDRQ
jgi:hypothetical protein